VDETELQRRAWELLRDCTTMSLATSGADGIWAADVFFAPCSLTELLFISGPSTQHVRNLLASPSVAATIHVDVGNDWRSIRGLQLAGTATPVADDELPDARNAYFEKFSFARRLLEAGSEVEAKTNDNRFYALHIARIYLVDNRLGFGVRHEIGLGPPT
jgi:uncharacterized protein YhbP (UPF0306 family)